MLDSTPDNNWAPFECSPVGLATFIRSSRLKSDLHAIDLFWEAGEDGGDDDGDLLGPPFCRAHVPSSRTSVFLSPSSSFWSLPSSWPSLEDDNWHTRSSPAPPTELDQTTDDTQRAIETACLSPLELELMNRQRQHKRPVWLARKLLCLPSQIRNEATPAGM